MLFEIYIDYQQIELHYFNKLRIQFVVYMYSETSLFTDRAFG